MRAKPLAWALLLSVSPAVHAAAPTYQTAPRRIQNGTTPEAEESRERISREMAKKANLERQAALKNDTDKLVKLSGELKEYVDKSNENMLSVDVLKKAEEIEKLAHSVKEKMRGPN